MKAWIFSVLRKVRVFAKRALTWYVCKNKKIPRSSDLSATENKRKRKYLKEDDHVEEE